MQKYFKFAFLFVLLFSSSISPQKKVYLILGSDTAVWEGMAVNSFVCHYDFGVIPDVTRNYYAVMQPGYRNKFHDSYGGKVKFTWWLMGGNIFRYADNKNVPYTNTMVPWIAKKYYGSGFQQFGDELSMHYHTFVWTDYDHDGRYFWNQAKELSEYQDDFDYTLAQYLLEENIYPVSFRAGWNYMSNDWQNYIDKWLPYSMHNQYPSVRSDSTEPIDNVYDWSHSSSECVPFHPSALDYQVPGSLHGYELRSVNYGSASQSFLNSVFSKANSGTDQVVCIWGHVWDDNFPSLMLKVDTLAGKAAASYPAVQYKYCTAVEAMQLWKKTTDLTPPLISFSDETSGNDLRFIVEVNKSIFQQQPFVAVKDIYENFTRLDCSPVGTNRWRTNTPVNRALLAKAAVAVVDTSGNLATRFIDYLPDDIYFDDESAGYQELYGPWSPASSAAWGLTARQAALSGSDSASVKWRIDPPRSGLYNIFVQCPASIRPCAQIKASITAAGSIVLSKSFTTDFVFGDWLYIGTVNLAANSDISIELCAPAGINAGKIFTVDAIKLSALVKQKEIYIPETVLNAGSISQFDTLKTNLKIYNRGIDTMAITALQSSSGRISTAALPAVIQPMSSIDLSLSYIGTEKGTFRDTIYIFSTDPGHYRSLIVLNIKVEDYFRITDNEDGPSYSEYGNWSFSNAHAFGLTSRYAQASQNPKPYAVFKSSLSLSGLYDIWAIVPTTANASTRALYILKQNDVPLDSVYLNQNTSSGNWVWLFSHYLNADQPVQLTIAEAQSAPGASVLRADAIKISIIPDASAVNSNNNGLTPETTQLVQNYPNPFNASTRIRYRLAQYNGIETQRTTIIIYDILGKNVETLVDGMLPPGEYSVTWNASTFPSGIYFCRLVSGAAAVSRKIVLIK